jgi:hypothetical protein
VTPPAVRIVTRAEWRARPPKRRHSIATPSRELWLHLALNGNGGNTRYRNLKAWQLNPNLPS